MTGSPPDPPEPGHGPDPSSEGSADEIWPGPEAFKPAPPPGVPKPVQRSFILWMLLAGLVLLLFVFSIVSSVAESRSVGGVGLVTFLLLLAGAAAYGAAMMRLGKAWGRILAVIAGSVLGLVLLLFLYLLIVLAFAALTRLGLAAAVLFVIIPLIIVIAGVMLVVVATVLMFRPAANAYVASRR